MQAKSAQKELRVCSVVWPLEEKVSLADKIRVHTTSVQPFSYKLDISGHPSALNRQ